MPDLEPLGFLRTGFLLETFFFAAVFLGADFVLTAAFFFAEAFFFDDERFAVARLFAGLRAGFFLAMPQVYQMILPLRCNPAAARFRVRLMQRSLATIAPCCSIFIVKTLSQAHDNPISLAFGKAVGPWA